ncbi:MAG: NUDIX domain-containing protein [Micropepsaceae bacterium]
MFDKPEDGLKGRAVRPRHAATLILTRPRHAGALEILMGKRSAAHRFMPNKYVFPGGKVDIADGRLAHDTDLRPEVLARVAQHGGERLARALARAAIRETFEEAGLVLGRPSAAPRASSAPGWSGFFGAGYEPDLSALTYVARAITPPYRDRRFDTRFFIANVAALAEPPEAARAASGELLELVWVSLEQARALDLPTITRAVLDEIETRADDPHADRDVPFFRFAHGKPLWSRI